MMSELSFVHTLLLTESGSQPFLLFFELPYLNRMQLKHLRPQFTQLHVVWAGLREKGRAWVRWFVVGAAVLGWRKDGPGFKSQLGYVT